MASVREHPLPTVELLAVDTETNGLGGPQCELTELATVLVGGGELHDEYASLVGVTAPLRRGIQRFTGISQAMVDAAPAPRGPLCELERRLSGRVLVAHNAPFDVRVLRQAFEREGMRWPDPPVLCTVALARRFAPLATKRGLAALAGSLGIEVAQTHRALPDAQTCARVLCALFGRLCAVATTVGEAEALCGPGSGRRARRRRPPPRRRTPEQRPDLSALPSCPGVYVFRDRRGRALYVGKSVSLRSRARAHFCAPAGWTERADVVDYEPTGSELGALVLENRLIKRWQPAGNRQLKRTDRWVYLRARLDIEYPILDVATEPAPGNAINVGPLRGRRLATDLADHLTSLFGLRHCGRSLTRRDHPSIYGQMGRCCSPCLGDLDPNAYRRQVELALAPFERGDGAARELLGGLQDRIAQASSARRYEAAAALQRRHDRLASVLDRLEGMLVAVHSRPRLVIARHDQSTDPEAFWIVAGRIVDWGPLPHDEELSRRTAAALEATTSGTRIAVPAAEVDEVRIVAAWIAEHGPPSLELDPEPTDRALALFRATALQTVDATLAA